VRRAGITLDNWKLPVFRKALTDNGFDYEDGGAVTADITLLLVETDDIKKLGSVLFDAAAECARQKLH
jgi:hypothetical protein